MLVSQKKSTCMSRSTCTHGEWCKRNWYKKGWRVGAGTRRICS